MNHFYYYKHEKTHTHTKEVHEENIYICDKSMIMKNKYKSLKNENSKSIYSINVKIYYYYDI